MSDIESIVIDCERRRCEATVRGDFDALGQLLDDRARYVHGNALVDTKAKYLATLSRPGVEYRKMQWSEQRVRPLGDGFAMHTGKLEVSVNAQGTDVSFRTEALSIWARGPGGDWTLIAFQPTPIPAT